MTTRKYGHGDGYGDGPTPNPKPRGMALAGGDDFYVQKVNRDERDFAHEDGENGLPNIPGVVD